MSAAPSLSERRPADREALAARPAALWREAGVVPLAWRAEEEQARPVLVAEDADPWPWWLLARLEAEAGKPLWVLVRPRAEVEAVLHEALEETRATAAEMVEEMAEKDIAREVEEVADLLETDDDAPVVRLVNALVAQALRERASDVHIEPYEREVLVRFRIDGVLHTIVRPPASVHAALVSRIKVMAGLDIAEKRLPQDGRFFVRVAGREVDVRVSILPTAFGERVVLRLLDRGARMLSLEELGMAEDHLALVRETIASPHGIALVTGPTGSGKTTTLYAALLAVDRENRNVMTIEDPVEYRIAGVAQMQVRPKIGLTFAAGLRSILRQDPDIVMVGEIRDLETAEIAIQASLTGHLVLATLHTNDALSSIVRLTDMGVEPYLVASSLILVEAQRLVRRLCPACKRARAARAEDWRLLDLPADAYPEVEAVYEPVGCAACRGSGYRGRIAIYEMAKISEALRAAIHDGASLDRLRKIAAREGMRTLRQDGARHVAAGITSIEEVLRVTREGALEEA